MKKSLIFGILLIFSISAWAQNSTQGKEFWFSFMENGYKVNSWNDWVETQVMVSAKRACSGTIRNPLTSWQTTFSVGAESTVMIDIPESAGYNETYTDMVANLGLQLTATDTVSVYVTNFATNSFDATFVLPVESLGTEYIVQCDGQSMSHQHVPDKETSAFLVVAVEDGTEIEVTPSVETLGGHQGGQTFTIALNAGQTFSVRSNYTTSNRDLSGTRVAAKDGKKVALFSGNTLTCIPGDLGLGHDHIFEQSLPVDTWGRQFAITGSVGRQRDLVKVTSAADNDSVWCNGSYLTTLSAGQSHNFWLYGLGNGWPIGSCFIETSQPSHVCLYNTTSYDDTNQPFRIGDPSEVWIPPIEQRISEITFCTFHHYQAPIDEHYVNIVVDRSSIYEVSLDGSLIDPTSFHPISGNDNYCFVRQRISHGNHHLSCPWGMVAHVYGFGQDKGYAYCAGSNLLSLNAVLYVNGELGSSYHNGLNLCAGKSVSFKLKTNYDLRQVRWDFDDGNSSVGAEADHVYAQVGDYVVKVLVEGINSYSQEVFYDTLTFPVYVKEADYHYDEMQLCDVSMVEYYGTVYSESGYYESEGENENGCYGYYLTLDLDFTPEFEIQGEHRPIGGSETYISANEYSVKLNDSRASIDTVLWRVDRPDWIISPNGKGENCTLYIYSFLPDTVWLHAEVINRCDSVTVDFFIKTSYFGVKEDEEAIGFTVTPNPTNGEVTLHFEDLMGEAEIELYDLRGSLLERKRWSIMNPSERVAWSITNPKPGLYFLKAKTAKGVAVKKIVIK